MGHIWATVGKACTVRGFVRKEDSFTLRGKVFLEVGFETKPLREEWNANYRTKALTLYKVSSHPASLVYTRKKPQSRQDSSREVLTPNR